MMTSLTVHNQALIVTGGPIRVARLEHEWYEDIVEAEELIAHVGDRLASYKRPNRMVFVAEIPRSPSGKVLRRVLKERLWTSV